MASAAHASVTVLLALGVVGLTIALGFVASSANDTLAIAMSASPRLASRAGCSFDVHALARSLDSFEARVRATAQRVGTIDFAVYVAAPREHVGARVLLRQSDFARGTLRLETSGVFELVEDIVFEPTVWRADRTNAYYASRAFALDFFAALTVEAPDVVIELGGHTLRQSRVHALVQRFFALIELAPTPFISGQGPADFGAVATSVDGVVVANGHLGRSSHHALHGNGGRRALLRNLTLVDYEVAAVALNGFTDTLLRGVDARGTATTTPVLGTFSNARFAMPFAVRALAALPLASPKRARIAAAYAMLVELDRHVVNDVLATGVIDRVHHPRAHALYANEARITDGNAYGLALHPLGAAVGPFWSERVPETGASERVYVVDSRFAATHTRVVEVVALVTRDNATVRGPAGDVLRLVDNIDRVRVVDTSAAGRYVANPLADLQLALLDVALDVVDERERRRLYGTTRGGAEVLRWARGELTLRQLVTEHGYQYRRNGDTMFHVNKGAIGVRVDGARDVCFERVVIESTHNTGPPGNVAPLPGERDVVEAAYVGADDGGHPDQAPQRGYMGADARGIAVSGAERVHFAHVRVAGVHALEGTARGIDVFNAASETHFGAECCVSDVCTLTVSPARVLAGLYANGPSVGAASGVHCSGGSASSLYGGHAIVVSNVTAGVFEQAHLVAVGTEHEYATAARPLVNTYEV